MGRRNDPRRLAGFCLLGALAACGNAAAPATSATAPPIPGPTLNVQLSIAGVITAQYRYAVLGRGFRSCADLSNLRAATPGRLLGFSLPVPPAGTAISGHPITIAAIIAGYHGPGRYDTAAIEAAGTLIALDSPVRAFHFAAAARAEGQIGEDGSGAIRLTGLEDRNLEQLSTALTWTCAEPSAPAGASASAAEN